jgi:hypothetical protein
VDRLTRHGWHPYSFAIGTDDISPSPVVTARRGPAAAALGPQQILALSPMDVWATFSPNRTTGVATLVLLHWNGKRWSKITGKLPNASLTGAIASDGSGGVWLAAVNAADTVPLILHFLPWQVVDVSRSDGQREADRDRGTDAYSGHAFRARDGDHCGLRRVDERNGSGQVRAIAVADVGAQQASAAASSS